MIKIHVFIDAVDEVKSLNVMSSNCKSKSFMKVMQTLLPLIEAAQSNEDVYTTIFFPHCGDKSIIRNMPEWRADKVLLVELKWT
jgi:hypothetical protein